jgi:hypothetical protein
MSRRVTVVAALAAVLIGAAPQPATGGGSTGEVIFRLTIEGPMPADDGFLLDVECDGDIPLCDPPGNFICVAEPIIDTPSCGRPPGTVGPTTVEMRGELVPQTIEWRLIRVSNLPSVDREEEVVLSGSWTVHTGQQVLTLGYVYPDPSQPAPTLPDTATAPRD